MGADVNLNLGNIYGKAAPLHCLLQPGAADESLGGMAAAVLGTTRILMGNAKPPLRLQHM